MTPTPPNNDGTSISMLWWQGRHPPANPTKSFSGKTILITGANVGLGFEAALKFAALGAARLILGVRSLHRGEEAKAEICRRTGYEASNVHLYEIDMSTFASVKALAKSISKNESRLDVAILNAGMAAASYQLSPEGYEMSLQVNVLSTAMLAILLLPQLRESAKLSGEPSHLEFVGSAAHHGVKADTFNFSNPKSLDQVNDEAFFRVDRQYHVTKLFLMYLMDGLVEAISSSSTTHNDSNIIIITTLCPGYCRTNLGRDFSSLMKIVVGFFQLLVARTAEQGSRTIVSAAILGQEANGQFWSHDVFYKKGDLVTSAQGKELQRKVWAEIMEVLRTHITDLDEFLIQ